MSCGDPLDYSTIESNIWLANNISTGQVFTLSNGGSSAPWSTANNIAADAINVTGSMRVSDDIMMKGKSLDTRLDKIEERLGIIHHNNSLEERWIKLKRLGEKYKAMEKELLEKEHMWNILKK